MPFSIYRIATATTGEVNELSTEKVNTQARPSAPSLQEAFRKALRDPDFHREFKKLSGFDALPLMPEEQDNAVRELPRDREVVELFKKLSGADPLPTR